MAEAGGGDFYEDIVVAGGRDGNLVDLVGRVLLELEIIGGVGRKDGRLTAVSWTAFIVWGIVGAMVMV